MFLLESSVLVVLLAMYLYKIFARLLCGNCSYAPSTCRTALNAKLLITCPGFCMNFKASYLKLYNSVLQFIYFFTYAAPDRSYLQTNKKRIFKINMKINCISLKLQSDHIFIIYFVKSIKTLRQTTHKICKKIYCQ